MLWYTGEALLSCKSWILIIRSNQISDIYFKYHITDKMEAMNFHWKVLISWMIEHVNIVCFVGWNLKKLEHTPCCEVWTLNTISQSIITVTPKLEIAKPLECVKSHWTTLLVCYCVIVLLALLLHTLNMPLFA